MDHKPSIAGDLRKQASIRHLIVNIDKQNSFVEDQSNIQSICPPTDFYDPEEGDASFYDDPLPATDQIAATPIISTSSPLPPVLTTAHRRSNVALASTPNSDRYALTPTHRQSIKKGVKRVRKFQKRVVVRTTAATFKTARAATSVLADFKYFVERGNVVDLAMGIIIGGAFTSIVNSLVGDIIGPIIGLAVGSQLQNAFVMLRWPDDDLCDNNSTACAFKTPAQAYAAGGVTWNYGNFFQTIINFVITASILFFSIKLSSAFFRTSKIKLQLPKRDQERDCPFCLKKVPYLAVKCYLCTSTLPAPFLPGLPGESKGVGKMEDLDDERNEGGRDDIDNQRSPPYDSKVS
ncbi:large-conductance mechanosensitive channel [Phlyctochytrium arcticum]|nr:large-conductance mechanosensitive channel [Phlyctochytrium arcticum]